MDITFACESCGRSMVIDEAGALQLVDCPKCGTSLEVPYKSKPVDKAPQRMKLCPDCGQMLPASALACDCGWDSSKRPRRMPEVRIAPEHIPQQAKGAIEVIVKDFDIPLWSWIKMILGIWGAAIIIVLVLGALFGVIYLVVWSVIGRG